MSCRPPMWEPPLTLRKGMRNLPFTEDPPKEGNVIGCLTEKYHSYISLEDVHYNMGCSCARCISRMQPSNKYGRDRPALLSALHPQMFLASLSFAYFAKALSGSYMKSTITQLERRFDIPSYLIGVIDGSFEIGELVPPLLRTEYCCLDAGSCL